MQIVRQRVVVNPLKPKADGTANITGQSLLEIDKFTYEFINNLAFDKEEVIMVLVSAEEYEDFIINEANRLAKNLE